MRHKNRSISICLVWEDLLRAIVLAVVSCNSPASRPVRVVVVGQGALLCAALGVVFMAVGL